MKKFLALLLVAIMVFSFVACNGGEGGKDDATPTPSQGEENPTGTEVDFTEGGKFMNFPGVNGDDNLKLQAFHNFKSDVVTILYTSDLTPDPLEFHALRDVYGLSLETTVVGNMEAPTKFLSMYMGGEAPDVYPNSGGYLALVNKGYLEPWDKYIDFSLGLWADLTNSIEAVRYNGGVYLLDGINARWDMVWWNADLFAEAGVKTPQEYYDEGNWTWDTFRQCALDMQVDSDSDGIPEIWGCAIDDNCVFIYGTGKEFITINPDGTVENNLKSAEIARGVQFYIDMVTKDGVVYDGNDGRDLFAAGKLAMNVGGAWYRATFPELIKSGAAKIIPYPADPQADKYYVKESFGWATKPSGSANPEGGAAYMVAARYNKLFADNDPENLAKEAEYTIDEQIEAWGWSKEIEDYCWDVFYASDRYPTTVVSNFFSITDWWGEIWFTPQTGTPWSTVAEEVYPQVQARIEEILEG